MTACNAAPSHRSSQLRALLETGCEWFPRRHPKLWPGRPAHNAARQQRGSYTFHLCRRMIGHSKAKQFVAYLLLGQGPTRETILYAAILPRLLYDCPYSRPYNTQTEKSPCPSGQLSPKEKGQHGSHDAHRRSEETLLVDMRTAARILGIPFTAVRRLIADNSSGIRLLLAYIE